jgi:hypothetical protein
VGGALVLVGTRVALWLGVQLLLAGVLVVGGATPAGRALNDAAGWWMVYGALVDLGTLGVIGWLLRRDGRSYRYLLGPPAAGWQVALGALGVLAATVPAVAFGAEINKAFYGDATPPMLAVIDVPPLASIFSVLVVPLLAELAEPVAYLGVILPRLERRLRRSWLAAAIVVAVWAGEHAFYPLLTSHGSLDLGFRLIARCRCCRSWRPGPRSGTPWGGGCCRSWRPGGSSTAAPPWPLRWAWSDEPTPASMATVAAAAR